MPIDRKGLAGAVTTFGSRQGPVPAPGPLRRSSQGTLHDQLYRSLLEMISNGTVAPGERMPTEAELVDTYGVSRTTARRALDELRRQGVVERSPGRGTFVRPPQVHAQLADLHSLTEEIEQLGYRAGAVPLSVEEAAANETVAALLAIAVGDPVLVVARVRTADQRPVMVARAHLNITHFSRLPEADFSQGLYPQFEQLTGRAVTRAVQWLSAVPASQWVARNLQLKPGAPVLHLERVVFVDGDVPIEAADGFFHGDLYKHYSEMARDPGSRKAR